MTGSWIVSSPRSTVASTVCPGASRLSSAEKARRFADKLADRQVDGRVTRTFGGHTADGRAGDDRGLTRGFPLRFEGLAGFPRRAHQFRPGRAEGGVIHHLLPHHDEAQLDTEKEDEEQLRRDRAEADEERLRARRKADEQRVSDRREADRRRQQERDAAEDSG